MLRLSTASHYTSSAQEKAEKQMMGLEKNSSFSSPRQKHSCGGDSNRARSNSSTALNASKWHHNLLNEQHVRLIRLVMRS